MNQAANQPGLSAGESANADRIELKHLLNQTYEQRIFHR
ncbi:MAG: hypothetical protein RLZZ214_3236 [Verrucomicrobiota bacterium]|jgi:hypothetical protein